MPADPSRGQVWRYIVELLDRREAENEYVSVVDQPRRRFAGHSWSIGGGSAAEEDVFVFEDVRKRHSRINEEEFRGFLVGEKLRDEGQHMDTRV